MILVLENGQQVDSNDTETLEKAAATLEQEALEAATALDLEKAAEKGELTPEKARKILHDGEVHGRPLTEQQRKYFGAVAGGTAKKSESVTISSIDELANYGGTLEKAKRSLQAPKEWWDKTIKAVAATPKYKGYKRERLAKIVGDIWTGLDDKKKKEIRGRYGKEFGAAVEKSDDAPGESLEETSTKELKTTLDDIKARLKKKPGDAALLSRQKAISAELGKRQPPDFGTKSMASIEALEQFSKAIYIGPRGGRWLDPKHTIPWKAEGAKKPAKAKKEAGVPGKKKEAGADALAVSKRADELTRDFESAVSGGSPASMVADIGAAAQSAHKKAEKAARAAGNDWNADRHMAYGDLIARQLGELKGKKPATAKEPAKKEPEKKPSKAREKRDAAANAIRDMFHSGHYEGKIPDKDAKVIFASKRWASLYGKGVVKKVWNELVKEGHMKKEGNVWVWGLAGKKSPAPKKEGQTFKPGKTPADRMKLPRPDELKRMLAGTKIVIPGGSTFVSEGARGWTEHTPGGDKRAAEVSEIRSDLYEFGGTIIKEVKKSLTTWLNEQETDMTNETELLKALGDDAELVKGMNAYGGQRITEWADQFYSDSGLETQALQCVKDMIACQKRWDAHHKTAKSYREVDDMTRKEREAYRDKQGKARDAISKEEDAIRMKMRDLESKLVDYRIKEASMRQAMGKSGVEALSDFAKSEDAVVDVDVEVVKNETGTSVLINYLEKAQGMPTGDPGMSRGPEDGADLSRKTGAGGSGDSAGSVIGAPGPGKKKKLSEDDDEVENQLKGRKKPIERMTGKSMAVPGHQREMVAHENAQLVSALRKGPDDITIGPGVPAPVVEPGPVHKANRWVQGEDSLVVYGDGSDAAAARLVKGEDFYAGGQAPALGRNPMILNQRKPCRACGATMAKSLSVCPHCGDGAGLQKQGTLRIAASAVRNGPGLRPSRGVADIVIK